MANHNKKGTLVGPLSSSGRRTRTADPVVNSHLLYRLSYAGLFSFLHRNAVRRDIALAPELSMGFVARVGRAFCREKKQALSEAGYRGYKERGDEGDSEQLGAAGEFGCHWASPC
jgi:hypothetical protein